MVVYHPHVSTKISLEQITNPTWRGPKIHLVPISRDFFCTSKKNVRNSRETIPAQQIETVKLENPMNCPIRYLWYQYSLLNWSIWLIMGYWLECSVISFPKTSSSDVHWTCDNRIIMPAWLSSYVNSIDQEIMQKQEMMDKHTMERLFLISFYRISSGLPMIKPYPSFISIISIIWFMIYVHILSLWYGYDLGKLLYFRNLKCWAIWGCRIMTYPLRTIIPHWGRTTWVRYNLSRNDMLVGGYNPSENMKVSWEGLSHILWKKLWNHQPDHHHIPIVIAYENHY
jgi:hypothetical protein